LTTQLEDLFVSIGDLERPDVLTRISTISSEATAMTEQLGEATVSRQGATVAGFLATASQAWSNGLSMLENAIVRVLDDEENTVAAEQLLADSFGWLRVGDAAYGGFIATLAELDPEVVTRQYPQVAFVGPSRASLYDAPVIAERLRLIRKFQEDHDIALTATTQPEPLGEQAGVPVIPLSDTFSVVVVVTNQGNSPEEGIEVTLTLTSAAEGAEPFEEQQLIAAISPGQARTVEFLDLDVLAGELYDLHIVAAIQEDSDLENNEFSLLFVRNEAE
jgi:hypothetical protein